MADKTTQRILIVDDNPLISDLFADQLGAYYEVSVAATGAEGVRSAVAAPPDAILLDINLPDLNGLEVLRYLAAYPQTVQVPVVIITASEYNAENEAFAKTFPSVKGFLSKMTGGEEIMALLQSFLGKPK